MNDLVKQLRSGELTNHEEIKKWLVDNLIEFNEKYQELYDAQITRNFWRKNCKPFNEEDLRLLGWKNFTDFKESILGKEDDDVITRDSFDVVKNAKSVKKKVYFVTSAITGERIDPDFFDSIKTFAKHRKAEIVVLPMKALHKDFYWNEKDIELIQDHICTEYTFNSNLIAMDMMLQSQMINPLTGLSRYGQKDFSIIVASPKQQLKSVAVSVSKLPHLLMSTGSISIPEYRKTRIGRISNQDHILGGLIVEIQDHLFHVRQVQALKDKSFIDLDKKYLPNGKVKESKAKAIVLGDWHTGFTDPKARRSSFEQIKLLKPEKLFFHDFMDSQSISHHLEKNLLAKINRMNSNFATLEKELDMNVKELDTISKTFPNAEINIVSSNHSPDHVVRYLKEGRWIDDIPNTRLSLDLFKYLLDGLDPIAGYIKSKLNNKNIRFLRRNEDVRIEGVLCSSHGDLGNNGSRGSINGKELSYGSSVTGHSHSCEILRNTWVVGTNSYLDLDYTLGSPSSWTHANCVINEEGKRQMLISIEGKWKL